jgi:16S rRNA (cytidine1402-2'-O)-methyltransferase
MPALYVVATPIGNLEDISQRAIRILKEVKLIAAEDTRKTRRLLTAYNIKTPTTSYHEHNKLIKLDYLVHRLEQDDIALVSDAGMPGISDPGYELIRELCAKNIPVVPIPGPSAILSALVASGLPTDRFMFLGFMPHKAGERKTFLKNVAAEKSTLVFFESPHRIKAALSDLLDILGNRQIAVCRELTKVHEEIFRGEVQQAISHFQENRGEYTLVVAGCTPSDTKGNVQDVANEMQTMKNRGHSAKEAIEQMEVQTGLSRKVLYEIWIKNTKSPSHNN